MMQVGIAADHGGYGLKQALLVQLRAAGHEVVDFIMWGEKDVLQKPAYASKLQETIPNAKLIWIKDAGHWLMEEKPEEVSGHLITFLDKPEDSAKSTIGEVPS